MRSGSHAAGGPIASRRASDRAARPLGALLGPALMALVFACGSEPPPETPGVLYPDQGNAHIELGAAHPPYSSTPATSGWHYGGPLAPVPWGFYPEPLPDEVLIHNLEHGGIGVHYNCPAGCADLVGKIAATVADATKIVMSPYPGMESLIALTAWNYLDTFDEFDENRIVAFIEAHESSPNAPEFFVP